jgi:hypothetical protein
MRVAMLLYTANVAAEVPLGTGTAASGTTFLLTNHRDDGGGLHSVTLNVPFKTVSIINGDSCRKKESKRHLIRK